MQKLLLFDETSLATLLSADMVDKVARAALSRRIGDAQLARESYDGLVARLGQFEERLANYRYRVSIKPVSSAATPVIAAQ